MVEIKSHEGGEGPFFSLFLGRKSGKSRFLAYETPIFRGHYGGTLSAPGGVRWFLIGIKKVDFLGGVKRKMVKKCSSYSLRASVNFKEKSVNFVKNGPKNPVLVL